jgi:uncharacterized protein (TIGR02996 family)
MSRKAGFSDEERALLDDIHNNPRDETPYLAYADWLESRGDPYGWFIRTDRYFESTPMDDWPEGLADRHVALQFANMRAWCRPLPRIFSKCQVHGHRGLPVIGIGPDLMLRRWRVGSVLAAIRRGSPRLRYQITVTSADPVDWLPLLETKRIHSLKIWPPILSLSPPVVGLITARVVHGLAASAALNSIFSLDVSEHHLEADAARTWQELIAPHFPAAIDL